MISYGGVILPEIPAQLVAFVESRISPRDAFEVYVQGVLTDAKMDAQSRLNWFMCRLIKINTWCSP